MGWTLTASNWNHAFANQAAATVTAYAGAGLPSPVAIACPGGGTATGSQTTCSSGNVTKVTDEAGVQRVNTTDGLGRLTAVVEAGINATTNYSYDVLGNLTGVSPGGYAGRSFTYDSLGRLYQASNPESGTTNYAYDNNSNLVSRTDGRGVMTCYGMISGSTCSSTIDALNRVTAKAYSGGMAPSVSYSYSGGTDFLISVSSSASTYTYANYDELARPHAGTQTTAGQSYTFAAVGWTPQGQVGSITYPSGRTVTTSFDLAGRISGVNSVLNSTQTHYVSNTSYAAQGGLSGMMTGDLLTRTMGYDTRLRNTSIANGSWLSLGLNWNANSTLQSQSIIRPGLSATQSYGYDGVSRLTSASEGGNWAQAYVYDHVGNRAVTAGSSILVSNYTPQSPDGVSVPFNGNNQWNAAAGYDSAGNMTALRTQTMGYDAESRMTSWTDSSTGASVSLTYDGDGNRVTKTSAGTTTVYVYDPAGNLAVEYGGQAPNVNGTQYLTQDHLGSTRLVTNASGCLGAHDYLPFGEEIPGAYGRGSVSCYGATDTAVKFTGQERDPETGPGGSQQNGFDNYLARFMASGQGRFLSVDPDNAGADPTNPQSWNMYGYALNSPLVYVDPTGTCDEFINGIRQSPGKDPTVDAFGANLITVFPYAGTNVLTGVGAVVFGSADVAAAKQGLLSALAQTPTGQYVNVTTISGGSGAFAAAYSQLSSAQQGRVGTINYLIPGNSKFGGLPTGAVATNYVTGVNGDQLIPSGRPSGRYNRIPSACGHDPACVLREQAALLKSSQTACPAPRVTTQNTVIAPPAAQPQSSGFQSLWNLHLFDWLGLILGGPQGTSSSTITYDLH